VGEPVKIGGLARDMIPLSGLRVGEDIDIAFTGVRPGEKLFEELRTEGEDIEPTVHPKVKVWKQRHAEWDAIRACLDQLGQLVTCHDREPIIRSLQVLVPEYEPLNPPQPSARPAGEGATEKV
jgi:FlaA1/EpsC-like NDP-sugar epimerase